MNTRQYTIRGVPKKLDDALRSECASSGRSLNSVLLGKLIDACNLGDGPKTNGLEQFAGTWIADPDFDAAIKEFDTIHPDEMIEWSSDS